MKKSLKETQRWELGNGRVKIAYKFAGYYVFVSDANHMPGNLKIETKAIDPNSYRPDIYINHTFNQPTQEIKIQTTSWGLLDLNEINKVLAGYTEAQMVACEIKKAFPECFGEH